MEPSAPITAKVDQRILVILSIFTLIFGSLGIYVFLHQPDGWQVLALFVAFLVAFWIGALSVRFSADEMTISYRSLFRRLQIPTASIKSIDIVAEFRKNAPQGVPRFYLNLDNGKREALNVKILPLVSVKRLCELLKARGVTVSTQDSFVAKRMASQIFGES